MRPLGLGELLDVAIKLCARNARTLMAAVLVIVVPMQVVQVAILASTSPDSVRFGIEGTGSADASASSSSGATALAGLGTSSVLGAVTALLAAAACYRIIASAYAGQRTTWRRSLAFAARRAVGLLWLYVLLGLAVGLATLLLVIPGVYLYVAFAVAVPVLMVEDTRGAKALGRSRRLVKGRWWSTFGVVVVGTVMASVVGGLLSSALLLIPAAVFNGNLAVGAVSHVLAGIAAAAITTPFKAAIFILLYFDLRVRKEGLDLELLLGADAPVHADEDRGVPVQAGLLDEPRYTDEERAQAPFWPPPPGWTPRPTGDAPE